MTGLDTNILVRFFTKDDPGQTSLARELLRTLTPVAPGFVSLICLIELVWVLRSQYRWSKVQLVLCLERLLNSSEMAVESHTAVEQAVRRFANVQADFADCLIERCCRLEGCQETVTFDVRASRLAGMRLLARS